MTQPFDLATFEEEGICIVATSSPLKRPAEDLAAVKREPAEVDAESEAMTAAGALVREMMAGEEATTSAASLATPVMKRPAVPEAPGAPQRKRTKKLTETPAAGKR